jgi:cytochrome b subunit of formate dehydrogenase
MSEDSRRYRRFRVSDRVEHWLLTLSFGLLGLTGLVQKFATASISEWAIGIMGGIETVRVLHRVAAVIMMLETVYHLGTAGYKIFVLRTRLSMLPGLRDVRTAIQSVLYNVGISKDRPQQGRYTFEEKLEYWAVVWGTLVMGITGFMLWNPIATARFLPGDFIPAAKAAHGGEALLAVLAIIVWHLYHVHIRHLNLSMFTGHLSEEEMLDEHPLELAEIKAGVAEAPVIPEEVARRRPVFFLVYGLLAVAMLVAVYFFVNMEETAIATVPPPEEVVVYAPMTPTPLPTPLPAASEPAGMLPVDASAIPHLVTGREECRSCHGDEGQSPLPADHQGRANDFCQACHAPVPVPAILHPIEGHELCLGCHGEGKVAEFSLQTHQGRGDADCQTCHDLAGVAISVVQHEVEGHEDCLTCHGPEAFEPYPDSHEGWRNEFCLLCHAAAEAPAEEPHPFPQDHGGTGGNCVLCHVDGDLTSYSCETCHPPASMDQVHEPRGISETESKCTLCHLTGETP